jgi:hypothetical protein
MAPAGREDEEVEVVAEEVVVEAVVPPTMLASAQKSVRIKRESHN